LHCKLDNKGEDTLLGARPQRPRRRLASGCQGELAEANGNWTLVHHWESFSYIKLTIALLFWSLLLRNCGQIPAKETGKGSRQRLHFDWNCLQLSI